jgi:hypothetical protein
LVRLGSEQPERRKSIPSDALPPLHPSGSAVSGVRLLVEVVVAAGIGFRLCAP